ncbi:hypothetical protein F528_0014 [Neisseria meningitidis 992008]|nr:hypothetical protein F528_0014 [Neisseria meningitidis 992008]
MLIHYNFRPNKNTLCKRTESDGYSNASEQKKRTFLPARTGTETAHPIRTAASSRLSYAKTTMSVCRCI